ncbi:hypothetical protein J6590_104071 [Homalodisca vitripennis]|nr:hypothetical protein J6590_104071 [Homalodisca vitripennis]
MVAPPVCIEGVVVNAEGGSPLKINRGVLPHDIQEQDINIKCDSHVLTEFQNLDVVAFWLSYLAVYPQVALEAAKLFVQYSSTSDEDEGGLQVLVMADCILHFCLNVDEVLPRIFKTEVYAIEEDMNSMAINGILSL